MLVIAAPVTAEQSLLEAHGFHDYIDVYKLHTHTHNTIVTVIWDTNVFLYDLFLPT